MALSRLSGIFLISLVASISPLWGQDWAVSNAQLRFDFDVTSQPSQPEGGVFLTIPDGGILPTPSFELIAFDGSNRLDSAIVWHNPSEGVGLIVGAPAGRNRKIQVYVSPSISPNTWNPRHAFFRPGVLFYSQFTRNPNLRNAEELARDFSMGNNPWKDTQMGIVPNIHFRRNPFGNDSSFVSYATGWLKIETPGSYYICTVSNAGSLVRINGNDVIRVPNAVPRRQSAQGQLGNSVTLQAGLHRVEYYQFFGGGGMPELMLAWRTPAMERDAMPVPVPRSAFVQSGSARLQEIHSLIGVPPDSRTTSGENQWTRAPSVERQGVPPAAFSAVALSYLWFGEQPLNLFNFQVRGHDNHPEGTTYRWYLGDRRIHEGPRFSWLIPGNAAVPFRLEIRSPAGESTATVPVYFANAPSSANPDRATDRENYRAALRNHLRVAPEESSLVWGKPHWEIMQAIIEPLGDEDGLLALYREKRRDEFRQLPKEQRWPMEFSLFASLRRENPEAALALLEDFRTNESDLSRKFFWGVERVNLLLYELARPAEAKNQITSLKTSGILPWRQEQKLHFLTGDGYRLAGNRSEAAREYELARRIGINNQRTSSSSANSPREQSPDWRDATIRAASYHNRILQFVNDGFFPEALALLEEWEKGNPAQKMEGSYLVAEATLYLKMGDFKRARAIAGILNQRGIIDNFLPSSIEVEMKAIQELKDREAMLKLKESTEKLLPQHPINQKLQKALESMPEPSQSE